MTRPKEPIDHGQPLAVSPAARPAVAVTDRDRLRPWLLGGMTALYVARPLFPSESAAQQGDGLAMVMLWIALAVFWLLGAVGRPRFDLRFGWTDAAVLLLVGWHTVAALWAVWHGTPRPAVNMLWEWIGLGLAFVLARQFITTERESRAVTAVMVALAVAISGYGLYQYAYEMPQTRAKYAADPERMLQEAGLGYPPGSPERGRFESRLENREPIATFALTNSLAALLAPWLVMLAGMACDSGRNRKRLVGIVLCAIPLVLCLLLTKSRSAMIAAAVGLALVGLMRRTPTARIHWKWLAALVATAILLAGLAIGVTGVGNDLAARASKSFGYRLQYWQSTVRMIADHPMLGCGPGNFQNVYTRYKLPEASEEVADPHNFLLEIWATAGTPAMLAFLAVLACFAVEGGRKNGQWAVGSGQPLVGMAVALPSLVGSEGAAVQLPPQHRAVGCGQPSPESLIPNPQSPIPGSSPDASRHVLLGGALGFVLSVPFGLLSAAPPSVMVIDLGFAQPALPAAVLLGLPLAAAAIALLWGWIAHGRWSPRLPAIGVVVVLVDLLATGGIGLPSVAGTFWLLLALGLVGQQPRELPVATAWAALALSLILSVTCYATAYNPVLGCQAELRRAEREPIRAVEHLEAAAAADPLSAEPWRQLAAIDFETWWRSPDQETFRRFQDANAKVLELAPNSAPAWLASGDWYFRALSQKDRLSPIVANEIVHRATESYRQAVSLYPNNATFRAKLAEACRAAGDQAAFCREARLALELDEATPHPDKKLSAEQRDHLVRELRDAR